MFYDDADLVGEEISLKIVQTFPVTEQNDVPSYLFAIKRNLDGAEVGGCTLRVKDDENMYYRGNVGFTVYEKFRGNYYSAKAVKLVLLQAKKHKMPYVFITCEKGNVPSEKAIIKAGGDFLEERKVPEYTAVYKAGGRIKKIFQFPLL